MRTWATPETYRVTAQLSSHRELDSLILQQYRKLSPTMQTLLSLCLSFGNAASILRLMFSAARPNRNRHHGRFPCHPVNRHICDESCHGWWGNQYFSGSYNENLYASPKSLLSYTKLLSAPQTTNLTMQQQTSRKYNCT